MIFSVILFTHNWLIRKFNKYFIWTQNFQMSKGSIFLQLQLFAFLPAFCTYNGDTYKYEQNMIMIIRTFAIKMTQFFYITVSFIMKIFDIARAHKDFCNHFFNEQYLKLKVLSDSEGELIGVLSILKNCLSAFSVLGHSFTLFVYQSLNKISVFGRL